MTADGITYVGHATTLVEVDGTRLLTDPVLMARIGHIRRIAPPPPAGLRRRRRPHLARPSRPPRPALAAAVARGHSGARASRIRADRPALDPASGDRGRHRRTRPPRSPWTCRSRPPSMTGGACPSGRSCRRSRTWSRAAPASRSSATPTCSTAWAAFSAISTLPCCRSGAGGRASGRGTSTPSGPRGPPRCFAPRIVVPIHWGTLAGPRVWWRADPAEPARRFAELVAAHAPDVTVRILAPGERLALPGA